MEVSLDKTWNRSDLTKFRESLKAETAKNIHDFRAVLIAKHRELPPESEEAKICFTLLRAIDEHFKQIAMVR